MLKYIVILGYCFVVFLSKAQNINVLVAGYSFNKGDARDDVGSNSARLYNGTFVKDRFGNAKSALYLRGSFDSYINLGSESSLKPKQGTISFWVNIYGPTGLGTGIQFNPFIITKAHAEQDCNEAYFIGYDLVTKKIATCVSASQLLQKAIYANETTSFMEWQHIVISYDDSFFCFYLNGVLQNKVVKGFKSIFLEGDSVLIGYRSDFHIKRTFHGCVDDLEIYKKVLTQGEILALYNAPDPDRSKIVVKWFLACLGFVSVLFLIIWFIKWRIKKAVYIEKKKNQLRNERYEQENKVLKAQMDPHFIFNSLNTIQQFIIINDNEKAQLYLSKFSRLLRKILESNLKDCISLKEEIEILEQYLEVESLRFNNVFKHDIEVEGKINLGNTYIPHFLIQPFVENAIWHGLLPKDGDKQLNISFKISNEKALTCTIEDNGVGRKASSNKVKPDKDKSLAINFIQQRLELLCSIYDAKFGIQIEDKADALGVSTGTRIQVTIPILPK